MAEEFTQEDFNLTEFTKLVDMIIAWEGLPSKKQAPQPDMVYKDSQGYVTLGYGIKIYESKNSYVLTPNAKKIAKDCNLTEKDFIEKINSGTFKMSDYKTNWKEYFRSFTVEDIKERITRAKKSFKNWNVFPKAVRAMIINVYYQYGSFSEHPRTKSHIENQDYEQAAKEFLDQRYLYESKDVRGYYNARLLLDSAKNREQVRKKYNLK